MDILIIDDESSVREVLQLCLERSGYRVRSACSTAEAFALLEGYVPEVVICDLHLSGMNGRDFCVTISDFLPTTKIFLMTGDVSSPKSCANFTVIHKPLSTTSLIKLIGPSHSEIDGAGDLGKRVEHISGSAKKFVLVLKSGPPRFTFMDWYELGFVTTWTRRPEEAEQILERHAHDLLAIDLGSNVAQVQRFAHDLRGLGPGCGSCY